MPQLVAVAIVREGAEVWNQYKQIHTVAVGMEGLLIYKLCLIGNGPGVADLQEKMQTHTPGNLN